MNLQRTGSRSPDCRSNYIRLEEQTDYSQQSASLLYNPHGLLSPLEDANPKRTYYDESENIQFDVSGFNHATFIFEEQNRGTDRSDQHFLPTEDFCRLPTTPLPTPTSSHYPYCPLDIRPEWTDQFFPVVSNYMGIITPPVSSSVVPIDPEVSLLGSPMNGLDQNLLG